MSKTEIKSKFDEIVAFAEVERFLDTPVKHYSSGMYVRLAFAVAAHLEPEILIVDEVLAVGDAQFQKKCMGKMSEVGKEGRTVLFVSHNMNAIEQLCTSAISLEKGLLRLRSKNVRDVIKDYLNCGSQEMQSTEWLNSGKQYDNKWFKPIRFALTDTSGALLSLPVRNDSDIWVQVEGELKQLDPALLIGYEIFDENETVIYVTSQNDTDQKNWCKPILGLNTMRSRIPSRLLNEGKYRVEFSCVLFNREWLFQPTVNSFSLFLEINGGLSDSPYWMSKRPGVIAPVIKWS
jgi:lipopolysaccharide transport system ATP-binding protein